MKENENKKKEFRLSGKHLFLTYAKCAIPREEVLAQIIEKLKKNNVENYVISTEKHKDESEHVHCYINLGTACDIRDARKLDLEKEGKKYHGNYQTCRKYENVQRYLIKEGLQNVLSNMTLTEEGKILSIWEQALMLAEGGDWKKGLEIIRTVKPKDYLSNKARYEKGLRERAEEFEVGLKTRPTSEFNYPAKLVKGLNQMDIRSVHICGPSGLGKTQCVLAFLYAVYGEEVLYLRSIQGLRNFDPQKYKTILFDDIDVGHLSKEEKLNLLEKETPSQVKILYESVKIPPETNRIFVSNRTAEEQFGREKEIMRRIAAVNLTSDDILIKKEVIVKKKVTYKWDGKATVEEFTQKWRTVLESTQGRSFRDRRREKQKENECKKS